MRGPSVNIRNVKNGEEGRRTWDGLNKFMSKRTGYFKPFRNTPSTYPKAHVPITNPASAPCLGRWPRLLAAGIVNLAAPKQPFLTEPKQPFFTGCLQFLLFLVLAQLCCEGD